MSSVYNIESKMESQKIKCVFPQTHDAVAKCLKYQTFKRKYNEMIKNGDVENNNRSIYPRLKGTTKRGFKTCEELYNKISELTNTNIKDDLGVEILDIILFCVYVATTDEMQHNADWIKPYDKEGGMLLFTCSGTQIDNLGLDVMYCEQKDFDEEARNFQQTLLADVIFGDQEEEDEPPSKVDVLVQHIRNQELNEKETLELLRKILF